MLHISPSPGELLDMPRSAAVPSSAPPPETSADAVLLRLCKALKALVSSTKTPAGPVSTAIELERAYTLPKKLAWQLFKLSECPDPRHAANFLPGGDPLKRLLVAAPKHKIPSPILAELSTSFEALNSFITDHAGDRETFLAMLSGNPSAPVSPDADDGGVDRLHRRACFRAYAHFAGAQMATRYSAMFVRPDPDSPGNDTFLSIRGRLGLRRHRHDASITIDRYSVASGDRSEPGAPHAPKPLDPAAFAKYGAPLLPSFCTKPLPALRTVDEGHGVSRVDLASPGVGLSSAVNFYLGNLTQHVSHVTTNSDEPHGFHSMAKIDLPVELLLEDVFVHKSIRVEPKLFIYLDSAADESKARRDKSPLLKTTDTITPLGTGLKAAASPDLPRSTELLAHSLGTLNWDPDDFTAYRLRIEYPLVNTLIRTAFIVHPR